MPCTGTLTAMFSLLASTRPTAPTLFSFTGVGGGVGGATVAWAGCVRTMETMLSVRIIAAMMGRPYLVIKSSSFESSISFRFCDAAVVHVGDAVREIKYAAIVRDNDYRSVGAHGGFDK